MGLIMVLYDFYDFVDGMLNLAFCAVIVLLILCAL